MVTLNSAPPARRRATVAVPPNRSGDLRARAPGRCRCRPPRGWPRRCRGKYGSQIRSRSRSGTPGPWSVTVSRAVPFARSPPAARRWPGGPNFTALSSRLSTAGGVWPGRRALSTPSETRSRWRRAATPRAARTRSPPPSPRAEVERHQRHRRRHAAIQPAAASTFSTRCSSRVVSRVRWPTSHSCSSRCVVALEAQRIEEEPELRQRRAEFVGDAGHEVAAEPRQFTLPAQLRRRESPPRQRRAARSAAGAEGAPRKAAEPATSTPSPAPASAGR